MNSAKTTIMVQARTGSRRLPRKVLAKIEGKPMIWQIINRLKKVKLADQIILITTTKSEDKILLKIAEKNNIFAFAGSINDVLERHFYCALKFKADPIIRITSDCPLTDPSLIDKMIKFYQKNDYDYVSNTLSPTYPDGLDVEIFSFAILRKLVKLTKAKSDMEHVTSYIRKHQNKFKIYNYQNRKDLSSFRWTVDEKRDLTFIRKIYSSMKPKFIFSTNTVLSLLSKNPNFLQINEGIMRNQGYLSSKK